LLRKVIEEKMEEEKTKTTGLVAEKMYSNKKAEEKIRQHQRTLDL